MRQLMPSAKVTRAPRERGAGRVGIDVAGEAHVELQDVGPQIEDAPKARIAGADIVDRDPGIGP